ncbi:medium-chain acyl-CoA ligase ACSF2, mitochondrial-like [Ptychodera flava]|uniref:medium-chain acyl-CoA ligase ACSF2, mitochondrial-like n=1 Tax=Ptychodera flava TaxID=63121 RepID=UPI00396A9FCB
MAAQLLAATTKLTYSYCHTPCQRRFCGKTIGQVFDMTSDRYPEREAITYYPKNGDVKRINFRELRHQVDGFARGLIKLGLQKGERLGIVLGRRYEYIVAYLGAVRAGLVVVRHFPFLKAGQLGQQINKVGCSAVVIDNDAVVSILELVPEVEKASVPCCLQPLPSVRCFINIDSMEERGACLSLSGIIGSADVKGGTELQSLEKEIQPDDPAVIFFTSGSTGTWKAVVHSHHALVESFLSLSEIHAHLNEENTGCHLCVVNMYSVVPEALLAPMLTIGDRLVLTESVDVQTVLYTLQKERCTSTVLSPSHVFEISNLTEKRHFSSLKLVLIGGNIVPKPVFDKIKKVLTPNIQNTFGMTEALLVTSHVPTDPVDGRVQTVGRPFPHAEIKVVDDNFKIVPVNTEGEICIRGPNVFIHYHDDEEKTSAAKTPTGWFKTGDVGVMLDDGRIRHLGRKDDCIKKNAFKIYPIEIERHLVGHSKVQLCQAVAIPDEKFVNEVCLCVVLRPGVVCTEEEIMGILKEKLDKFQIPKHILFFDSLPTTQTGKIARKKVAEMAAEKLEI